MARIAINGFGRIGRLFFRQAFGVFDIVAINDLSAVENLAYLLRHDTVYWGYGKTVTTVIDGDKKYLVVDGVKILVIAEKDPVKLPWGILNIDVVVECTGLFESFSGARAHITAGAKRVVISAPARDEEASDAKTVLLGVNEHELSKCVITSNGSCTTNAAHPVAALMAGSVGIKKAMLTTVHGYTATQSLVDGVAKSGDLRRGRAAAANIVPSSSGVTVSIIRALPNLAGKFDGIAVRVPVLSGSLVDFTFVAGRPTTIAEVNAVFAKAAQEPRWQGVLGVTAEPLVSSDILGMPYGAIIDLSFTKVVDGDLVKVLSWYDNEWGYASTLVKHVEKAAKSIESLPGG